MQKLMPTRSEMYALTIGLLFIPVVLLAADATPPPNLVDIATQAVIALTPILSVGVLWVLKLAWSKIPASLVLFAAPVVGLGVNYVLSYITGHPSSSPLIAALLGAAATYLREFVSTVLSKGLSGSITPTKLSF